MNEQLIETLLQLALTAIAAYEQAGGTAITVASVQALMPNPTPLTQPDAE